MMIEPLQQRLEGPFYFRKVDQPPRVRIRLPLANQLYLEAMPVKAGTLVPGWRVRQAMGRLKRKGPHQSHATAGRRRLAARF